MERKALIDGDLIIYEISVLGQYYEEEDVDKEHIKYKSFAYLEAVINNRISEICEAAGCDDEPVIYLSGKNNFRYDIATVKPYKGNRKDLEKPIHFENVKWYLISRYKAIIVDGMEADDALAIHQSSYKGLFGEQETVICSRDKDLRQVSGWHYGWEVGLQPEYKLKWVTELGELNATYKDTISEKTGKELRTFKKLSGVGYLWFCAQILTGDATDNIPGLPKFGPKRAFELLRDCTMEADAFQIVKDSYAGVYGDEWESFLLEQARLVWMVRGFNVDGSPTMFELEKSNENLR